jgi:hypothetical protein
VRSAFDTDSKFQQFRIYLGGRRSDSYVTLERDMHRNIDHSMDNLDFKINIMFMNNLNVYNRRL